MPPVPASHLPPAYLPLASTLSLNPLLLGSVRYRKKERKKKTFPQICYLGSLLLCVAYSVVIISLFPSPFIPRANVQIDDTLKLMAA